MLLGGGPGLNLDFATFSFQVPSSPLGAWALVPETRATTIPTKRKRVGLDILICAPPCSEGAILLPSSAACQRNLAAGSGSGRLQIDEQRGQQLGHCRM